MSEDNGSDYLESIIKVEPEEFQEKTAAIFYSPADNILRSKGSIFSDPIVFLERCGSAQSNLSSLDSQGNRHLSAKSLTKLGNEGKRGLAPHTCCFCAKLFANRCYLQSHLEKIHLRTKRLSCDLCPKVCPNKYAITEHMKYHGAKALECDICDFKTTRRYVFRQHKLTHDTRVECSICHKQVISLKVHEQYHKRFQNQIKKCDSCDKTFNVKEHMRRHKLREHYKGELYECHCGSVYNRIYSLISHQETHSGAKIKCEVCQKYFANWTDLKGHERHKHGQYRSRKLSMNGPFVCDKCGIKLSTRVSFRAHFARSHWSPDFFCDLCPRSFSLKAYLAVHIKSAHLKLRRFKCEICGIGCIHAAILDRHIQNRHVLRGKCEICHKVVPHLSGHLKRHVRVNCPVCDKVCSKIYLKRHIKIYHKQT